MRLPATVWSTGLSSFFALLESKAMFLFTEYLIVLYHLSYVLLMFAYLFCVVGIKGRWFLFTEYLIVIT